MLSQTENSRQHQRLSGQWAALRFFIETARNYQLFESNTLKEYGSCQIVPSLLVDPDQDIRGRYAAIVEAIEKQIAGVASTAQKHIQVGDKTIDRYSAS